MPYTIAYTDEANNGTITIVDSTIDQTTTLKLPGRNTTGYGTAIAENFLHLLENFASSTEPSRPTEGQLWYDTTTEAEQLKVFDGTRWVPTSSINKAVSEPDVAFSQTGDLWVDTDNQQLYLNSGSGWVLVGPSFSDGLATGAQPQKVIGTDNLEHTIILLEVAAQPAAIIATEQFTPKAVIPGFSTVYPGFNLSNKDITGSGIGKYYGTAEKADALVVNNEIIAAGNFLRGDIPSTSLEPLYIQNNTGVVIGTDAALNIGVEGQAGIIRHQIEGSSIDVQVKNSGAIQTVLRIDSNKRVGINTVAPDEALDVSGNIQTDGNINVTSTEEVSLLNSASILTKGGVGIAKGLYVAGNTTLNNLTTTQNIVPSINNVYNIGTATEKYQSVYATTFIGSLTGKVNGTVSGAAGSAKKLSSPTIFRITGDFNSSDITFDGQTGGTLKIFDTSISSSVITERDEYFVPENLDSLLINVNGNTDGELRRISVQNLFSAVPKLPVGMIAPFAGIDPPLGWKLCDGSLLRTIDYEALEDVIGDLYAPSSTVPTGYFRLPDLRGRLPLGADNMGGTSADRVTEEFADSVGAAGGTEEVTVGINNLPEHTHDMRGDSGDQYYALRDISGTPTDNEAIIYDAPASTSAGQALPNSGGVKTDGGVLGEPISVVNPVLTINYIIYTGVER